MLRVYKAHTKLHCTTMHACDGADKISEFALEPVSMNMSLMDFFQIAIEMLSKLSNYII
jgi:hypothetical protein